MLTAYDYSLAHLIDEVDVDMILVGDSLANVVLGLEASVSKARWRRSRPPLKGVIEGRDLRISEKVGNLLNGDALFLEIL